MKSSCPGPGLLFSLTQTLSMNVRLSGRRVTRGREFFCRTWLSPERKQGLPGLLGQSKADVISPLPHTLVKMNHKDSFRMELFMYTVINNPDMSTLSG